MIIYIFGEDTFLSRQFLKEQVMKFKKTRDPQGFNTIFLNGLKENEDKIIGEIVAFPFLSERRMIVIENLLSSNDKDLLNRIIDLIKNNKIPESNVVMFWQGESFGKTNEIKELAKLLQNKKHVYNFYEFKYFLPSELRSWIIKEVKARGGIIEHSAASYLGENINQDMWLLNSLIDQLIAFKNDNEIKLSDVRLFLDEKVVDNIFQAVESIVSGDKKTAFKLLNEQRRLGQSDTYLFGMILRQFRILLQLRDLWEREDQTTSDSMAKLLGLHPFVVKKSLPLVKRYSMIQLKNYYTELFEVDIKTKTGLAAQDILIDCFVGKIK
ncbi:MAG: DNA polymerase III subunit delta [Candidatus Magasanikbacteria bacterium CG10_big_fil_rev_8_21_14_0_10_36_32]|uniref:DNA polymerase III subunit delta n=1 Tax=Candidatus Magasanikbacteria bacterium CG10_big_fil_rev_8_21_14_0_10_36_32 TaxID=1974646 RepID=A0A2M6W6Z2_9BACT|nr:MAG: DNA polymerase III subunit delta [Candidatus Magasanikbacteria bacterium CG10_big_fil_rev_8_21_14_0_10_36_32]